LKNKLRETEGKKIRWQYFTSPIIFLISCPIAAAYWTFVIYLVKGELDILGFLSDVFPIILVCVFFAIPFIVLAVLNRYCFGEIICVMNEDGIHHKDGVTKWSEIEKIEYEIQVYGSSSRSIDNWSLAVVYTKKEKIFLLHAPLFILYEVRKHSPGIDAKVSKSSKWLIGLIIASIVILPFVVILVK